jgi:hypothetical protein
MPWRRNIYLSSGYKEEQILRHPKPLGSLLKNCSSFLYFNGFD